MRGMEGALAARDLASKRRSRQGKEMVMFNFIRNSSIAKASGRDFAASIERVDDVSVIRPKGRVSRDGGDLELRGLVLDLLRRGEQSILIDLEGV
jgi:hypothetical protein